METVRSSDRAAIQCCHLYFKRDIACKEEVATVILHTRLAHVWYVTRTHGSEYISYDLLAGREEVATTIVNT